MARTDVGCWWVDKFRLYVQPRKALYGHAMACRKALNEVVIGVSSHQWFSVRVVRPISTMHDVTSMPGQWQTTHSLFPCPNFTAKNEWPLILLKHDHTYRRKANKIRILSAQQKLWIVITFDIQFYNEYQWILTSISLWIVCIGATSKPPRDTSLESKPPHLSLKKLPPQGLPSAVKS